MKNISDQQLKAYFLGKLPEPEAEILEIECASDAALFEQAERAERELTDDFLRGNLTADEKRLYETNYLVTEARCNKLQFAARLWELAAEPAPPVFPVASAASTSSFWQSLFGRRALRLAGVGLFLLLAGGIVAFYVLTADVGKTEVAEVKEPLRTIKAERPPVQNPDDQTVQSLTPENQNPRPVSTNREVHNKAPEKEPLAPPRKTSETNAATSPKAIEPNKPVVLMTVKLLPGSVRGEAEQSLTIAPNVKNLRLLLSPSGEPNNYKIYRAVVRTPENGTVYTTENLKSLSFQIAAEKLESRTYIVSLEGRNAQNEFESIADYTFRVRRTD